MCMGSVKLLGGRIHARPVEIGDSEKSILKRICPNQIQEDEKE